MSDAISVNLRIFASPDSVDRVAACFVGLLNSATTEVCSTKLAGIFIRCDSCSAKSARGDDARAALNLAQEAGWSHDFTDHSDLCPDCRKDRA